MTVTPVGAESDDVGGSAGSCLKFDEGGSKLVSNEASHCVWDWQLLVVKNKVATVLLSKHRHHLGESSSPLQFQETRRGPRREARTRRGASS